MSDEGLRRRAADRALPPRFYRDVWLFLISLVVLFAVWKNTELVTRIQDQRRAAILETCRAQNERHDQTIRTLDVLIREAPPDRRARAQANRAGTVLIIRALAPHQDCAALLARRFSD